MLRAAALSVFLLSSVACASSSAPPAQGPAPAPAPESASDDDAAATAPTAQRAVVIHYGPMTDVMDSTAGQLSKTRAAIEASDFVRQLVALDVAISYVGEPERDDTVVVRDSSGRELGAVDRHAFHEKGGTADLLDAVKQGLGL